MPTTHLRRLGTAVWPGNRRITYTTDGIHVYADGVWLCSADAWDKSFAGRANFPDVRTDDR